MTAETACGLGHPCYCSAKVSAVISHGRGEEMQSHQLGPRTSVVLEVGAGGVPWPPGERGTRAASSATAGPEVSTLLSCPHPAVHLRPQCRLFSPCFIHLPFACVSPCNYTTENIYSPPQRSAREPLGFLFSTGCSFSTHCSSSDVL